jgi:hypothetical protein
MILWIDILAFLVVAAGFAVYLELSARQARRFRQKSDASVGERKRLM